MQSIPSLHFISPVLQREHFLPLGEGLEFGPFHCHGAASEVRPAFQGRSRQPNPLTRRRATDEIANPNGVRDSSAADAARIPYVGHPGTGLERLAYSQAPRRGGEQAFVCPTNITSPNPSRQLGSGEYVNLIAKVPLRGNARRITGCYRTSNLRQFN